jgi:hypothetical protein
VSRVSVQSHGLIALPLAALAALAACSDPVDPADAIAGTYQVTRHSLAQATSSEPHVACDAEGPITPTDPPYLALVRGDDGAVGLQFCVAADPASCMALFDLAPDDGDFRRAVSTAEGIANTACTLTHVENVATRNDDGSVRIEFREWAERPDPPPSDCSLEVADALPASTGCRSVEVLDAVPVGGP